MVTQGLEDHAVGTLSLSFGSRMVSRRPKIAGELGMFVGDNGFRKPVKAVDVIIV
jgi:hypothetical protein